MKVNKNGLSHLGQMEPVEVVEEKEITKVNPVGVYICAAIIAFLIVFGIVLVIMIACILLIVVGELFFYYSNTPNWDPYTAGSIMISLLMGFALCSATIILLCVIGMILFGIGFLFVCVYMMVVKMMTNA